MYAAASRRVNKIITIDSLNNGDPFYFVGEFLEGVHYFFSSAPDITTWYAGLGNADGDIDLDIKQLHIYDVVSPNNVQLDVEFNVTGNYVLLSGKIVVDAYNGSSWIKISTGDYVQCADGSFIIPVILPSASFGVNSVVTIRVRDYETYGLNGSDSTDVIATVTINTPTLTAGTEGNVTGTSNGAEVDVYYRVSSPEGAWEVFEEGVAVSGGNWSATGTIADAGTYDFIAEDTTDRDGSAQVDDVEIIASYIGDSYINRDGEYFINRDDNNYIAR